ncbi:hypothetical protein D3C76_1273770 [compost metagenome]
MAADDQIGAGIDERVGQLLLMVLQLRRPLLAPMGHHEHQVGVLACRLDGVQRSFRRVSRGDPRLALSGDPPRLRYHPAKAEQGDLDPFALEIDRSVGFLAVLACADIHHMVLPQGFHRILETGNALVQYMVIRQVDRVHAGLGHRSDRFRRRLKNKRFILRRISAGGHRRLQIQYA